MLSSIPDLNHPFYGSLIDSVVIGPRHEITLEIELWPEKNGRQSASFRQGEGTLISVRFGGIYNFEEVKSFWTAWQSSKSYDSLHYLRYSSEVISRPNRLCIEIEFDRTGDYLKILCRNVELSSVP